jgi:hypothetical protein
VNSDVRPAEEVDGTGGNRRWVRRWVGGESVGCGEGGKADLVDAALSSKGVQQLAGGDGGGGQVLRRGDAPNRPRTGRHAGVSGERLRQVVGVE